MLSPPNWIHFNPSTKNTPICSFFYFFKIQSKDLEIWHFSQTSFPSQKCQHQYLKSNILGCLLGTSQGFLCFVAPLSKCLVLGVVEKNKKKNKKMTVYTQLRINDAHRMFWIFSPWCVKGGLGACNSRLGTPRRGGRQRGWKDSSDIHLVCICGVDGLGGRGWGGGGGVTGKTTRANTNTDAHARRGRQRELWFPVTLGESVKVDVFACICIPGGCSPVISRTVRNTLSFSGSRGSILW